MSRERSNVVTTLSTLPPAQ